MVNALLQGIQYQILCILNTLPDLFEYEADNDSFDNCWEKKNQLKCRQLKVVLELENGNIISLMGAFFYNEAEIICWSNCELQENCRNLLEIVEDYNSYLYIH